MKSSVGFIKIPQVVYKTLALTFLPLKVLIFIMKSKKVLKIIISGATLTNKKCILIVLKTKKFKFLLKMVKNTKKIPIIIGTTDACVACSSVFTQPFFN